MNRDIDPISVGVYGIPNKFCYSQDRFSNLSEALEMIVLDLDLERLRDRTPYWRARGFGTDDRLHAYHTVLRTPSPEMNATEERVASSGMVCGQPGGGYGLGITDPLSPDGAIPLKKIVADKKRDAEKLRRRPDEKIGKIERSQGVSHNVSVIAGTRIPTGAIRRFKEAGYTVDQIIAEYPDLTPRDVEVALQHEDANAAA
jgi:uncharacterized protein (DUF433 family)